MKSYFLLISALLLLCFSSYYYAQDQQIGSGSASMPIILNYADSLIGTKGTNFIIREVCGKVALQQGIVNVICDKAKQYITANNVELLGHVVITQEDLKLKSSRIFYNGNKGRAESFGFVTISDKNANLKANKGFYSTLTYTADFYKNVTIKDDSVRINADTLQYKRLTRESFAWGNVKVEDDSIIIIADRASHYRIPRDSYAYGDVFIKGKYNNVILRGDTVINIRSENYTKATGNPVLFQIDTVKKKSTDSINKIDANLSTNQSLDTLTISSKTMEAIGNDSNQRFIFTDSVEIVRNNLSAKAQKAYYLRDKELIYLEGNPIVWYDSTQLYADTIIVSVPNKKLSSIKAVGNGFAISMTDTVLQTRKNQILGNTIDVKVENDTLKSIISIGNSKSLYFMYDNKESTGATRVSADTIQILFKNSQPDTYFGKGGVFGEVLPEKDVQAKAETVYLPNYKWTDLKPKKKTLTQRQNYSQLFDNDPNILDKNE